jgi:S-adenosylmethionine/arginine decarboxylase-like enzyme
MKDELTIPITLTTTTLNEPEHSSNNTPPWGWHLILNLYQCDSDLIQSAEVIQEFVIDLCDLIDMRRFGQPIIVNFGDDPTVAGYSMFQLIETSNISGHFANESSAAYLDIFSCKAFDPQVAAEFCIKSFKAKKAAGEFAARG